MANDTYSTESTALSPDEAFAALGNAVRLQILRTLGAADEPLAYSDIFDRVEYDDSSNFDYHLEQLVGHFVSKTEEGYDLWQAGQRVVEAVLSGAITDNPILEPTTIDDPCPYCGADTRVAFQQERVEMHCTECSGMGSGGYKNPERDRFDDHGTLGHFLLPPAGIQDRTANEVLEAAEDWTATQIYAISRDICPRCSAPIEYSTKACENHPDDDGRCEQCEHRHAALFTANCTNCLFELTAPVATYLGNHTELMEFMIVHGIDPRSPQGQQFVLSSVEESVLSTDPFESRFLYTVDGEALTLTVDDSLSVTEATKRHVSDPR
ncbi:MAG: winged helix-turn-helix domain-containing protein [Halopenitus sp.]